MSNAELSRYSPTKEAVNKIKQKVRNVNTLPITLGIGSVATLSSLGNPKEVATALILTGAALLESKRRQAREKTTAKREGQTEEAFWKETEQGWTIAGLHRKRSDYEITPTLLSEYQHSEFQYQNPEDNKKIYSIIEKAVKTVRDHPHVKSSKYTGNETHCVSIDSNRKVSLKLDVKKRGKISAGKLEYRDHDREKQGNIIYQIIKWNTSSTPMTLEAREIRTIKDSTNIINLKALSIEEVTALQKNILGNLSNQITL